MKVEGYAVGYQFLETMGMTMLEGRTFSPDYGSDLTRSVVLNASAVRELGENDSSRSCPIPCRGLVYVPSKSAGSKDPRPHGRLLQQFQDCNGGGC